MSRNACLQPRAAQRHVTLGAFIWERGSINDGITRILNENMIPYRFTLDQLEVDILGIGYWEKVNHTLFQNDVCEVYVS